MTVSVAPRYRRVVLIALMAISPLGCQLYWRKPGADLAAFAADHHACVRTAGHPVNEAKTFVLVNLDVYRACLKASGWSRETGSKTANPPGYFRGLENEGPVRVGEVPKQVPWSEPVGSQAATQAPTVSTDGDTKPIPTQKCPGTFVVPGC